MTPWPIYTGSGVPHDGIDQLPAPPNWRTFDGAPVCPPHRPTLTGPTPAQPVGSAAGTAAGFRTRRRSR